MEEGMVKVLVNIVQYEGRTLREYYSCDTAHPSLPLRM